MEEERLDKLLEGFARRPVPEAPGNLKDRVWRTIRQRSRQTSSIPGFWPAWLLRPQFALGLVIASAGTGLLLTPLMPVSAAERKERVRQALALEVFGSNPLGSPHRSLQDKS